MATVTVLRLCLAPLAHALQTAWQPLARLAKYLCSLSFREMREIVLQYVDLTLTRHVNLHNNIQERQQKHKKHNKHEKY